MGVLADLDGAPVVAQIDVEHRQQVLRDEPVRFAVFGPFIGKQGFLVQEHGEAVDFMRAIKRALDPRNLLNPGKVVPGL